jgi:2-methylaconitate cis-trans-isomerase PrpF
MEHQQIMVKAVIALGGNSRGVYLLRSQLPTDSFAGQNNSGYLW